MTLLILTGIAFVASTLLAGWWLAVKKTERDLRPATIAEEHALYRKINDKAKWSARQRAAAAHAKHEADRKARGALAA
jgi:hypothetical protein